MRRPADAKPAAAKQTTAKKAPARKAAAKAAPAKKARGEQGPGEEEGSSPAPQGMKLLLVAVGQRQPAWADAAFDDFAKRFPPECRLELKALKAEPRSSGKNVPALKAAEAARIGAALPKGARRVMLDQRGERCTTAAAGRAPARLAA